MSIPTKSFESPVSLMGDDLLGRWRLAKDVYAIIGATPKDWSCRIGVYGKWGEGKTSLLQFVETQAQADGLISFWVNPSQAESADGLWRIVIDAFIDALDREGVLLEEVRTWRVRMLAENTAPADKLAELNKYAKAIVGFGREAIREWLKPDGEQVRKLRDKLHSKTVLVFIDDLDRTDPKLVPTLLLGLRDLLDLPGFCFLLAFDDEIISQSLMTVNKAWGDGRAFLDKILDFSFALPKATPDQRLALVEYHIQQLCPWTDLEVVKQNSDLLPQTPRKMKALLRNLMTLDPLMRRHDPAEIQWVDFFFGQLLRLEAPNFLSDFLKNGNDGLVQVGAYMPQRQEQPPFEQRIDSAVKESGVLDEALRARLSKILSVWSERRAFTGTKNFGYYAGFGSTHRELTQREFEAIAQLYSKSLDFDSLLSALSQHAAKVDSPEEEVAQEFLKLLVEARAESLEEAADAEIESDTIEHLSRARRCLELIEDVLKHPTSLFFQTPAFNRDVVQSLFSQVFRWIHFNRSVYQDARSKEKEFLLSLARYDFVSGFL